MLQSSAESRATLIPANAGIGLRAPHYRAIIESRPPVGWLEAHSENYFGDGGPPLDYLERIRAHYPLSLHGVGLSLGSTDPLDRAHLGRLKRLIERFQPGLVSEHLSWSSVGGVHSNDLLPLPYTEEALTHFVRRVDQTQSFLKRRILIENPSGYLRYRHSTIPEWEFLAEVARRSGCGILLDVNNVHVSASNLGFEALHYLHAIPAGLVGEIHLAGYAVKRYPEGRVLIDDHGSRVRRAVWELFRAALRRCGPVPALVEWDSALPELSVLVAEAQQAQRIMDQCDADAA
jgi:hypothetical protein